MNIIMENKNTPSLSLSVLSLLVLVIISTIVPVFGQREWLTYENERMGFGIRYSADWEKFEPDEDYTGSPFVSFTEPTEFKPKYGISISVEDLEKELDTNTLELRTKTVNDYMQESLELVEIQRDSDIIRKNIPTSITDANYQAVRSDYILRDISGEEYTMLILAIIDDKLIQFRYYSEPLLVPQTLPIAQKMIDSFHITE